MGQCLMTKTDTPTCYSPRMLRPVPPGRQASDQRSGRNSPSLSWFVNSIRSSWCCQDLRGSGGTRTPMSEESDLQSDEPANCSTLPFAYLYLARHLIRRCSSVPFLCRPLKGPSDGRSSASCWDHTLYTAPQQVLLSSALSVECTLQER